MTDLTRPLYVVIIALALQLAAKATHAQHASAPLVTWAEINRPAASAEIRASYGGDPFMFGDLRLPPGEGPHPVAIVIHGGCWRSENDLNHISHLSEALRRIGLATWTLEYRRIGNIGGGWPGTFQDVVTGANHLASLISEHPLDATRIILIGHSAGGQLALWLAAHAGKPVTDSVGALNIPLRGVISLAGITDLRAFGIGSAYCNASVAPLLGGTPREVPVRYAAASPAELGALGLPILLVHGGRDPYVPVVQSQSYERYARSLGDEVRLEILPGAGHFDLIAPFSNVWRTVESLIRAFVPSGRQ